MNRRFYLISSDKEFSNQFSVHFLINNVNKQSCNHVILGAVVCFCCTGNVTYIFDNDNVKIFDLLLPCRFARRLTVPVDRKMDIGCARLFFSDK